MRTERWRRNGSGWIGERRNGEPYPTHICADDIISENEEQYHLSVEESFNRARWRENKRKEEGRKGVERKGKGRKREGWLVKEQI